MFSPELKKGSVELLILALVESRPRHGYEIGKQIEARLRVSSHDGALARGSRVVFTRATD